MDSEWRSVPREQKSKSMYVCIYGLAHPLDR